MKKKGPWRRKLVYRTVRIIHKNIQYLLFRILFIRLDQNICMTCQESNTWSVIRT